MNEKLIEKLKKLALRETCMDGFDGSGQPGYCCGNDDDTYNMGQDDGQTELARELLSELGIEYKK